MFTRIVVGVDCREGGRDALALASLLQAAGGGELVALHACASAPLLREDVLARVEAELARAGATGRAVVVTDRSPAHALRTIAEREAAELIVVGSSRRAGADRVLAGDDAAATLHCAPCAVAVAPRGLAGAPRALRRIGVGFDDSHRVPRSRWRSRAGSPTGGRRRPRHHGGGPDRAALARRSPGTPRGPATTRRPCSPTSGCSPASARSSDDDVAPETVVGTPWKELAERSADLDLLVVGARSYGPVRRLLLGSTSTKLARHAACPLLVTPRGAHGTAARRELLAERARPWRGSGASCPRPRGRPEVHLSHRSNWLRAAVLGANDGIVSTASLVLGVAASGASGAAIVTAGIAGLVAGALSMAAGEYVSVSSQRDAEQADIRLEERELRSDPQGELRELAGVYEARGLPPALASEVASPSRAGARCRRTFATSSGSTSGGSHGRSRPPGPRRCRSQRARHCRCWPSRWPRPRRESA